MGNGELLLKMVDFTLNPAVLFNNTPVNVMGIAELHQPFPERRVTEKLRYSGKHLQVEARGIFRRKEQKEDVNGLLINSIKFNPFER
ncbi:MAG: hypothetical protein H6Q53_804, partial [Deltaproteobacteria bacterium]|nr:hypothetical protein [Deltaproteobacteria bacterium]